MIVKILRTARDLFKTKVAVINGRKNVSVVGIAFSAG